MLANISACSFISQGRSVYDREGIRIGLDTDPSVRPSGQTGLNNHPIGLNPKDLEALLQSIQVSGYSGTIAGLMTKAEPVPLFTPKELSAISEHLATALREAKPTERVSFSLPKPDVTYSEDRTVGFLFFRGRYLHVVLTDHSSFIRTDTGGGEGRDIRDTKGMQLWASAPAHEAVVPGHEEPRWAHFERVHISLDVKHVLAKKEEFTAAPLKVVETGSPVPSPAAASPGLGRGAASAEDLHLQMQELTNTNEELRSKLDEQSKRTEHLQDQLEQLRREMSKSAPKVKPYKKSPPQ
jgi:hypothetical protein